MPATIIGKTTNNILNCCYTINLHYTTSNQIYWHRKLKLPLTSSIYLAFFPPETQRKLKQTKVYHALFHYVWNEATHKSLKVAALKTRFPSVYVIGKTCFNECFLLHVITRRHYFHESLSFLWVNFNRHADAFVEASVLKEVHILCFIFTITVRC